MNPRFSVIFFYPIANVPEGLNFVEFDNDPCGHRTDFSWLYVRNDLADPDPCLSQ